MRCPRTLRRFLAPLGDRRAATAMEYGLLCCLIAVAIIVAVRGLGTETISVWSNVSNGVEHAR